MLKKLPAIKSGDEVKEEPKVYWNDEQRIFIDKISKEEKN